MNRTLRIAALLAVVATPAAAQIPTGQMPVQPPPAEPPVPLVGPPIQRIETAASVSTDAFGAIMGVRELPDGRILVNDGMRRQLVLMDTTLAIVDVVLDSVSTVSNTYGTRPGALLPFAGDSVLFLDPASYAMVVITPEGQMKRVRSVWRVQDVFMLTVPDGRFGVPGLDARGRIVYRVAATPAPPAVAPPAGVMWFPQDPDSAFVVAVDLDTRRLDTLGVIRTPKTEMRLRRTIEGQIMLDQVINPLPVTDDWAVLADGTVAFVRALDYRIDYLNPDGTWRSSQKLPYEWQRVTDDDKERMVDSVRTAQTRTIATQHLTAMIRWVNTYRRPYPPNLVVPEGYVLPPGMPREWSLPPGVEFPPNYMFACPPGVQPTMPPGAMVVSAGTPTPPAPPAPGAARPEGPPPCAPAPIMFSSSGVVPPPPIPRQVHVMAPSELPDYKPPIPTGAVRADADGNLWIRTNPPRPIPGGPVYDIVSMEGELVNRIQLPPNYTLVGFGRDKVVYLSMRDPTGTKLARVRLR